MAKETTVHEVAGGPLLGSTLQTCKSVWLPEAILAHEGRASPEEDSNTTRRCRLCFGAMAFPLLLCSFKSHNGVCVAMANQDKWSLVFFQPAICLIIPPSSQQQ